MGPTVIESPPGSLCVVDDFWFRYVADMGIAGPDKGQGGRYLYLPPDHDGEVPDGYFTYRCPTYTNWVVLRALGGVPDMQQTRIYPLVEAAAPHRNDWVNWTEASFNTVHANDFSFYQEIDELIQEEPTEALDPERTGQLAAIGLVKGQPFAPDDRLRSILEQAAPLAAGMARALAYAPRDPQASLYGAWKNAFVGGSYEFLRNGARLLDARTRSLLQVPSTIWPALASNTGNLQANPDRSFDLYFGPTAPQGKESNWVQTLPGKSWFVLFRLYGPLQAWFDQTWKLNEFQPTDT